MTVMCVQGCVTILINSNTSSTEINKNTLLPQPIFQSSATLRVAVRGGSNDGGDGDGDGGNNDGGNDGDGHSHVHGRGDGDC
jgi:hypothetical protein